MVVLGTNCKAWCGSHKQGEEQMKNRVKVQAALRELQNAQKKYAHVTELADVFAALDVVVKKTA